MEQWRDIDGYDELYQVSSLGRVKSLKFGKIRSLKFGFSGNGYLRVCLWEDNKGKIFSVHRLVAQAFIPNPELKREVNHINGIKTDNRVENLEWCTRSENARHAFDIGLQVARQGEERHNAKLSNEKVFYIRDNPDGLNTYELTKKFNVCEATINDIQRGKIWKSIGGKIRGKLQEKKPRVPDIVREQIRAEYVRGSKVFGSTALAKKFGVAATTVRKIVNEK